MGKRDYAHRESKKPKKDSRKLPQVSVSPTSLPIEVVGKGKRKKEEWGEAGEK